ncbi:MAG: Xaa-Pro aminopeptidase [Candidatus Eremiobacteraeota bacterium]|nr:Xaa-Pro aminopeptidase [Candidatus Eremiobacteraeota bacterium]
MKTYEARREQALAAFHGGVAIIPSATTIPRNNDTEYEFRQNSDFYYLTGFDEPDAVLVLAPEHDEHRTILFLRERDRATEIWNGRRLGVDAAVETIGVDIAYPIGSLAQELPRYLCNVETLYYTLGNSENDACVRAALGDARAMTRRAGFAPDTIADPSPALHALRQIKSAHEIAQMRRSAEITAQGHIAAMRATRPGLHEYEIEAVLEYEFHRAGAQRTAYESIVAGGDNATILHYRENRDRLAEGTLLLVDAACEYNYYAADVTRTWPVNGRFSAEQRAIYDVVLAAQQAAIETLRPGQPQKAFHYAAVRVITEGLIELGLLRGSVDEAIERETYREYYMHGTGHWLGMDVHDVGRYRDLSDTPVTLEPGMVTTVEPGVYVQRDAACDERFRGIGVRIEDDLLITESGSENLTAMIPKSIDELEAIIGTCELEFSGQRVSSGAI